MNHSNKFKTLTHCLSKNISRHRFSLRFSEFFGNFVCYNCWKIMPEWMWTIYISGMWDKDRVNREKDFVVFMFLDSPGLVDITNKLEREHATRMFILLPVSMLIWVFRIKFTTETNCFLNKIYATAENKSSARKCKMLIRGGKKLCGVLTNRREKIRKCDAMLASRRFYLLWNCRGFSFRFDFIFH